MVTPVFAPVTGRMLRAAAAVSSASSAQASGAPAGLVSITRSGSAQAIGESPQQAGSLLAETASATAVALPVASSLRTRTREVGFQILCGAADKLLPSLQAGATGGVLALAACAPQACHEVYIAWKEGDAPLAEEKQLRLNAPSSIVAGKLGIPGIKHACDLNGYYGGRARLPLLPLTAEGQAEVAASMRDLRN